ncbi:MAG: 4Fe-4S binding protein [Candidatus Omnitrophica bacterium]|nr:4Fe-4S binding protein [Candidatus Omnitrophota bacterium]
MAKIIIKKELCKSCSLCISVCPKKILVLDDKLNKLGFLPVKVVNEKECIGCQMCVLMCPEACIEIYQDE